MQTIPRSPIPSRKDSPKGSWYAVKTGFAGYPIDVTLICPSCGQAIGIPHAIDEAGTVTPSVVCAYAPECSYHEFIRLEGWDFGKKDERRLFRATQ